MIVGWIAAVLGFVMFLAVLGAIGYRLYLWAGGRGLRSDNPPSISARPTFVLNVVVFGFFGVMAVLAVWFLVVALVRS